jgi:hypothetical protein
VGEVGGDVGADTEGGAVLVCGCVNMTGWGRSIRWLSCGGRRGWKGKRAKAARLTLMTEERNEFKGERDN